MGQGLQLCWFRMDLYGSRVGSGLVSDEGWMRIGVGVGAGYAWFELGLRDGWGGSACWRRLAFDGLRGRFSLRRSGKFGSKPTIV